MILAKQLYLQFIQDGKNVPFLMEQVAWQQEYRKVERDLVFHVCLTNSNDALLILHRMMMLVV